MLELWLCPSRKQNTARVMQALCEKTAQRILVVPEQFSHEAERMLCRAGGDTISRFAEVLSFSRLASRVFSIEGGSACEETDAGGRLLLMALAVEQVRPRLKLFGASTSGRNFCCSCSTRWRNSVPTACGRSCCARHRRSSAARWP